MRTCTRTFWFVLPSYDFERILRLLHHDTRHTDERGVLAPAYYFIIVIVAVVIINQSPQSTHTQVKRPSDLTRKEEDRQAK